jgi:hypothetical protein
MKNIIPALLIALSILTVSCGQKERHSNDGKVAETETVDISIEFKYAFDDTFKLYYSKDIKSPIDGSLMMTQPVHASKNFEKVTFTFPLGDYPRVIRLDVGNKQEAEVIEIKSIKITHGSNVLDESDWITTKNWSPNESLILDEKTNSYKIVPVNGVKGPVFMSNIVVQEKLNNYFRNK